MPPVGTRSTASLLRAADELHDDACVTEATYRAIAERYDERQMLDLVFTVGQYHLVSMALNTFRVAAGRRRHGDADSRSLRSRDGDSMPAPSRARTVRLQLAIGRDDRERPGITVAFDFGDDAVVGGVRPAARVAYATSTPSCSPSG